MAKDIAVAVLHGMGSQGETRPDDPRVPTFSAPLHAALRDHIGAAFDARIAWREVFWSDLLQERQKDFLKRNRHRISHGGMRRYVLDRLADAAAYRLTGDGKDQTYRAIHRRVDETLGQLADETAGEGRLYVIAHSLGGQIASNHVWDILRHQEQHGARPHGSGFVNLETFAGLVTFGCVIPIFSFAWDEADVHPIRHPGTAPLPGPWWLNFHDPSDIYGFPLDDLSPGYRALASAGGLQDHRIEVGGLFEGMTYKAHDAYWGDRDFVHPVADFLMRDPVS
jgi:hypothetical protein